MADQLLSTVDAARRCNVTTQTVRSWIDRGRISATRIGRRYRIPASEVDALLEGRRNSDDAARQGAGLWDGNTPELPRKHHAQNGQAFDADSTNRTGAGGDAWDGRVQLARPRGSRGVVAP
jgi:excisionase family DNA binding protein